MELSTVALCWRDEVACCFTSFRFLEPLDPPARARQFAKCIESFSTLQLYCVIVDEQILDWQPCRAAPPAGTAYRIEIGLYPAAPLNARAGISTLRITVPGPKPESAKIFTAAPAQLSHPDWKILEKEIMPYLRLPNGLPVSPKPDAERIQRTRLVEIAEQYRPQPGRPPVDAAISATIRRLDEARSLLTRAQRAKQSIEYELTRVENASSQLAYLQTLHKLEQSVWLKLQLADQLADACDGEQQPAEVFALIIDKTRYLPAISRPLPPAWLNVPPQDFANPDRWQQIGQLKNRFAITSERSFRRLIAHLKSLGLRTLPAQQDGRVRLFYRPDADRFPEMLAKKSPQHVQQSDAQAQPLTISADQLTEIWQAINQLQSQQHEIIEKINQLSLRIPATAGS